VKIALSGKVGAGKFVLIDDEDAELVAGRSWHAMTVRKLIYAKTGENGKTLLMHRLIMDPPADMHIDHINGDGLDNRRSNLRICTHAENMRFGAERRGPRQGPKSPHIVQTRGKFYSYAWRGGPCIFVSPTRPDKDWISKLSVKTQTEAELSR